MDAKLIVNVILLGRYDRNGASTRVRFMQYLPYLASLGIHVDFHPLFDEGYLHDLYAGKRDRLGIIRLYVRRIVRLCSKKNYDAIWLEKESLPWVPWWFENLLIRTGLPVLVDYDDAVFHRYDQHPLAPVRRLLGQKIDRVMASAKVVVAGNAYLAKRARAAGAHRVEVIPTVVDTQVYQRSIKMGIELPCKVGWIGTPGTWQQYMQPMLPLFQELADVRAAQLVAVGAGIESELPWLQSLPWSEPSEVASIQGMDIGIMPLDESPWSRGKCGYKLIQYMACGLPVVASPVGVNQETVQHGVNGFLANTDQEWAEALSTLIRDSSLRQRMGAAGRQRVEADYSLQVWQPRLVSLLRSLSQG